MSADARPLGQRLLAAGVPVVVVRQGERYPAGWQDLTAAGCDLSAYRPGVDALALVGGHGVDLVDEDTKAGGSAHNLPPFRHFGVTRTPSGGRHLVVPSSGLGKVAPLTTGLGHVGDYVGGRGDGSGRMLGFLPGSVRSKHGGRPYVEEEPWDVEACLASEPDPRLVDALRTCAGRRAEGERHLDDGPPRDPALGLHPYAAAAVAAELARLDDLTRPWTDGARWDDTTFEVACNLLEFANSAWTGYTADRALGDLLGRAPSDDRWGEREHLEKWASALAATDGAGRREPARPEPADDFGPVVRAEDARDGGGGWAPVDLAVTVDGVLTGDVSPPEPTVGDFGGGHLFYAGRINGVHGDSAAGKTWTALVAAAQELAAGETVAYVDLEDSPGGIVSRLISDLGVDPGAVRERLVYLRPDEPLTPPAAAALAGLLDARRPSLVVVDSTGEALAIEGLNPNADEEVARWFRLLPRLAARCGAAVLLLDHATKSGDNDLWPIGSQRKRAAVTGASYVQKAVTPFGRGKDGKAVLRCAKDRHGHYPLGSRVAALVVRGGAISLESERPARPEDDFRPTGLMERVSLALEAEAGPLSGRAITLKVTGKKEAVTAALDRLVHEGHVRREAGPRGGHLHTSVRPYREAADQGEDLR